MKPFLRLLLTGWLLAVVSAAVAQTTLTGRVTDASTGQPLPFASVFINATTLGTTTDEQGAYRLTNVPLGTIELVASYVGYAPARQPLRLETAQPRSVALALAPSGESLGGVTVTAKRDKTWERQLRDFRRELLGQNPFAGQCVIVNENVLRFEEQNGHLLARAAEPLVIENPALGYRLRYDLQHFDYAQGMAFYGGNSRFEALKPENDRQARRWRAAREQAYRGSTRHLLASLADGTHEAEGFLVYQINPNTTPFSNPPDLAREVGRYLRPVTAADLVQPGRLAFERRLVSPLPLAVYFTKPTFANPTGRGTALAYSRITLPQGTFGFTTNGWISQPNGMQANGFLGNDRLATLLPADWSLNEAADVGTGVAATLVPTPEGQPLPTDARLDSLTQRWALAHRNPAPTVFLHLDKGFYAGGDRLWLSAYLLDAATHQLRLGEEALHVDLIAPDQRLVQHLWLRAGDGRAAGDFRLPDSLRSGTYRLRSYTEADRLAARPPFERPLLVYNLARGVEHTPAADSLDIQLLPEGGRWVAGLPARLGVKTLGPDGQGRAMTGRILDAQGAEVARFTTNALGMGSVALTPQAGQAYRANVRSGVFSQTLALPPVEAEGLTLAADGLSDSTQLTLRVRSATPNTRGQAVYVVVQSRGRVRHEAKVGLLDGKARVVVPLAKLPAGLAQVTLFDESGRPWAERLVFVPETSPTSQLTVTPEKTAYLPRESVRLSLRLHDDTGHSTAALFSAAVTDADQVPADSLQADFRAHLLLTGELRGRVENPSFYFKNNATARQGLDDLLLTQGWRRVSWQAALADTATAPKAMVLRARVFDQGGRPVPGARLQVSASDLRHAYGRTVQADERGRFQLPDLALTDTVRLLVKTTDPTGKPVNALILPETTESWFAAAPYPPAADWTPLRPMVETAQRRHEADPEAYREPGARLLKEVVVKTTARPAPARPESQRRGTLHSRADAVLTFDEKSPRFNNLYEMLTGRVAGVRVTRRGLGSGYTVMIGGQQSLMSGTDPLYIVDGVYIEENSEGNALAALSPNDIERVEVIKGSDAAMYGVRGANGVIAFYTRRGDASDNAPIARGPGMSDFRFIGFRTRREFYVPKNEAPPEAPQRPDRRDVLHWQPLLETDATGGATLTFPLSDVARRLRVVVQGITPDGRPVVGTVVVGVR